ncbi:MAG: ABC transporter permease [Bacteroidota bacterium]|nr:ABC transporter permease [Bacteroidota bacterium]
MKQEIIRTPSYYVRKRLFKNWPAVIGMIFIVACTLIAIFAYNIMPDATPSANDGAVQIQKQPPGFQTFILKTSRNVEVEQHNFFYKMLWGQETKYTILPIVDYSIEGMDVKYTPSGRVQIPERVPIIKLMFPLYSGNSKMPGFDSTLNYKYEGDNVAYIDQNGSQKSIAKAELITKFKDELIEKRTYLLGTDKAGRDMLSRLLFGTRISLGIGFVSVLISLLVGVSIGAIGGYFGKRIDLFIMWLMTVVWSIPGIMLVIAISLALNSKGIWVAFVAVGLTSWVEIARVVRGQIMSIKEKTYVEAAKALGIKNFTIILKHILPNLMGPIIVIATSNFASAILTEAGLSFLGLGVQPPMPSWGMMVNEGFHSIGTQNSWHLILLPSLAISMLVLAFNLFGNGLRDAYDPQVATKW